MQTGAFFKKHETLSKGLLLTPDQLIKFVTNQVKQGQKEILTDAIKIFKEAKPEETIFTKNPIILELRGLRGDYGHSDE